MQTLIGSSYKDLMVLPADVRRMFGFALSLAQLGDRHDAAKVLKGFGGAGVLEVVEDDAGALTGLFTQSSFLKQCSSCTASKRRVSGVLLRLRKTWISSSQG